MGRNYKEQAVYDYLHDNKPVKGKLLWSVLHKFWRHNFHRGFYKQLRNKLRYGTKK